MYIMFLVTPQNKQRTFPAQNDHIVVCSRDRACLLRGKPWLFNPKFYLF